MTAIRTFPTVGWDPAAAAAAKGDTTVTLCFPCRDEAATIGPIVAAARKVLVDETGLVDELLVLDDRSTDGTAATATSAGATVIPIDEIHAVHGGGHGKGNALWASLLVSRGDLVVWCDGDVTTFEPAWISHLLAPLLTDESVDLVKALYHRPTSDGGGGRTTELVARPVLSLFAPDLAGLAQPLSGEYAGRRTALEAIPFAEGWGAEIAMVLDIAARGGAGAIVQVDLGERRHRHRSLHELSVQAAEVLATALGRVGAGPSLDTPRLRRADGSIVSLHLAERPPIDTIR